MTYTKNNKLSEIVIDNLKSVLVFEKFNIKFSTEGSKTLDEACSSAETSPKLIISELNKINGSCVNKLKIKDWKLDFLCDYIVSNHHKYIRNSFPVMIVALRKDLKASKNTSKNIDRVSQLEKMSSEFEIHMQKEEKLLFPYIKKLVISEEAKDVFDIAPFGLIRKPIEVIRKEHLNAIENISRLRKSYCGINKIPSSYKNKNIFCDLLNEFEHDLHIHIHLENNILLPKALVLERKILKSITNHKLKK